MRAVLLKILAATSILLAGCVASAPPAVGVWDIQLNTPLGAQSVVLTVDSDGTGSLNGAQGQQNLDSITLDGNTLGFEISAQPQGQAITLTFSGTIDGDALTGEVTTPMGAMPMTGTRR